MTRPTCSGCRFWEHTGEATFEMSDGPRTFQAGKCVAGLPLYGPAQVGL